MPKSFSQDPIGNVGMDQTPSVGRYFGGPQIKESSLAQTSRLLSGLGSLGLAVYDKVQDTEATNEANKIKEAGEDIVLSPSENRTIDDVVNGVVKKTKQVDQGRLSVDRRDTEMRRLIKELPPHLRSTVQEKLRAMNIEDPSQALIRRQSVVEQNVIAAQVKVDNELVQLGVASGDPRVYVTPGDPMSGIDRSKARLVGLDRQAFLNTRNASLEALGMGAQGAAGTGGGTTSGVRPEVALRIDPVMAKLRANAIQSGIQSDSDTLLASSNALALELARPSSAMSNAEIEFKVNQLSSFRNQLKSSLIADLTKTGGFNSTEIKEASTQIDAVFDEFVFDGSKDRIDEFKNKTLIVEAIARRDGSILLEKMPFLVAASKLSRNLVEVVAGRTEVMTELMRDLESSRVAMRDLHTATYDPTKSSPTTNKGLGKSYLYNLSKRGRVGSQITTLEQGNEVLNTGAALVEATDGRLPDPFKDVTTLDSLASEQSVSDLISSSKVGTASTKIVDYTYRSLTNASERILRRLGDKPGFGEGFVIERKGTVFSIREKPALAPGSGIRVGRLPTKPEFMHISPTVITEVNKGLSRVNKYMRSAERISTIIQAPFIKDLEAVDFMARPTAEQTRAEQEGLIDQPDVREREDTAIDFRQVASDQITNDEGGDQETSYYPNEADREKGNLTGGIGHLLTSKERKLYPEGTEIPEEVRQAWFRQDMSEAEADVNKLVKSEIPGEIRSILINMAFNLGRGRLKGFKQMLKAVNAGDYQEAARQMKFQSDGETLSPWYEQTGDRAKRLVALMEGTK